MIKALLHIRVSSKKQSFGSSLDDQQAKAKQLAISKYGYLPNELKTFKEVYTGSLSDRPAFQDMMTFASRNARNIRHVFVFDIDRLSRSGVSFYEKAKQRLVDLEIELVDVAGIIQPSRNVLEGIGGEFGKDKAYSWSVYSPSEGNEVIRAQQAKDEVRKIMLRTIPREIENTREGYESRQAPYGFENVKILIPATGKRKTTRRIVEEEAKYVRAIFELTAQGQNTDQICKKLNSEGFRTRTFHRWDKYHESIQGQGGGKPLTTRRVREFIQRVGYAGFKCEEWTWGHLVKAKHPAIVPVSLWNEANRGKWKIVKSQQNISGWNLLNLESDGKRTYTKNNPAFPFKSCVLCPSCGKPLKGAFSRGKSGKRFPLYFCNRQHKQVSTNPASLNNLLAEILEPYTVNPKVLDHWEWSIRTLWQGFEDHQTNSFTAQKKQLEDLMDKAESIYTKISFLSHPNLINRAENEYIKVNEEIEQLKNHLNVIREKELDIEVVIDKSKETIEHLCEFVVNPNCTELLKGCWRFIFPHDPTLADLENRTPEISPILRLKAELARGKNLLASPQVFQSNTLKGEIFRIARNVNDQNEID